MFMCARDRKYNRNNNKSNAMSPAELMRDTADRELVYVNALRVGLQQKFTADAADADADAAVVTMSDVRVLLNEAVDAAKANVMWMKQLGVGGVAHEQSQQQQQQQKWKNTGKNKNKNNKNNNNSNNNNNAGSSNACGTQGDDAVAVAVAVADSGDGVASSGDDANVTHTHIIHAHSL